MDAGSILLTKYAKQVDLKEMPKMGTQTITEVKKEQTDSDRDSSIVLGTSTHTATRQEATDNDHERNNIRMGTETFTKTTGESSDSDINKWY